MPVRGATTELGDEPSRDDQHQGTAQAVVDGVETAGIWGWDWGGGRSFAGAVPVGVDTFVHGFHLVRLSGRSIRTGKRR